MKCLHCGGEALTNMEFAHDAHCPKNPANNDLVVGVGHVSMYPEPQQGWQCPICKSVYSPTMPWCQRCQGPVPEDENARLQKLLDQKLDDDHAIRLMVDPEGRFKSETLVWIVNWLRQHDRIQPPKKTRKGWE